MSEVKKIDSTLNRSAFGPSQIRSPLKTLAIDDFSPFSKHTKRAKDFLEKIHIDKKHFLQRIRKLQRDREEWEITLRERQEQESARDQDFAIEDRRRNIQMRFKSHVESHNESLIARLKVQNFLKEIRRKSPKPIFVRLNESISNQETSRIDHSPRKLDLNAINEHARTVDERLNKEKTLRVERERVIAEKEYRDEKEIANLPKSTFYFKLGYTKADAHEKEMGRMEEIRQKIRRTVDYAGKSRIRNNENLSFSPQRKLETELSRLKTLDSSLNGHRLSDEERNNYRSALGLSYLRFSKEQSLRNSSLNMKTENTSTLSKNILNKEKLMPSTSNDYLRKKREQLPHYGEKSRASAYFLKRVLNNKELPRHEKFSLIKTHTAEIEEKNSWKERVVAHLSTIDLRNYRRICEELDDGYITSVKAKLALLSSLE